MIGETSTGEVTVADPGWTLLTHHAHVLLCIAAEPTMRVRDIAAQAGITERATHRIVADLENAGFVSHERVGRRNHYQVHVAMRTGHPLEHHLDIASLAPDPSTIVESGASR